MKCFCGVDLVPFNNDNAWKICPACRVEYASGGESLPAIAEKLAEPEDKFFVQVGPIMHYGSAMVQKIMAKAERGEIKDLNLIVLDVSKDDDHPAAGYVEDEEMRIVQVEGYPDRWWLAEWFFGMVDVKKFKVIEGEL